MKRLVLVVFIFLITINIAYSCANDNDCNSTSLCVNGNCVINANSGLKVYCKVTANCNQTLGMWCINNLCTISCGPQTQSKCINNQGFLQFCNTSVVSGVYNFSYIDNGGQSASEPYTGGLCVDKYGDQVSCTDGVQCKGGLCYDVGYKNQCVNFAGAIPNANCRCQDLSTFYGLNIGLYKDKVLNTKTTSFSIGDTMYINASLKDKSTGAAYIGVFGLYVSFIKPTPKGTSAVYNNLFNSTQLPISIVLNSSNFKDVNQVAAYVKNDDILSSENFTSVTSFSPVLKKQLNEQCTADTDCDTGLVCDASKLCKYTLGESCFASNQCQKTISCYNSVCTNLTMEIFVSNDPLLNPVMHEMSFAENSLSLQLIYMNVKLNSDSKSDLSGFDAGFYLYDNSGKLIASFTTFGHSETNSTGSFDRFQFFTFDSKGIGRVFNASFMRVEVNKSTTKLNGVFPLKIYQICSAGADCSSNSNKFCVNSKCVECKADVNCQNGYQCASNICVIKQGCTGDADCTNGQICSNGVCMNNPAVSNQPGGVSPGGSSPGSTPSLSCEGVSCDSNKGCYWNTTQGITTKKDFYVGTNTGMYCCSPWQSDPSNIQKDSGNALCVGTSINPVTGASNNLIEGECVSTDGTENGMRQNLLCPSGDIDWTKCTKLDPIPCKIVPKDLNAKLPFYTIASFILTLLMLIVFYVERKV